jgi:hypothetical protein
MCDNACLSHIAIASPSRWLDAQPLARGEADATNLRMPALRAMAVFHEPVRASICTRVPSSKFEKGRGRVAMFEFRPDVMRALFGAEDAEYEDPERLKQYFYRNRAYESLLSDLPIRIVVGHKGVGKSALLKMAHLEDIDKGTPSIWLQTADLSTLDDTYDSRFDKATLGWQRGLLNVIYGKIETIIMGGILSPDNATERGNLILSTSRDLVNAVQSLAKKHLEFSSSQTQRAFLEKFLSNHRLYIYIDDPDRGWSGKKSEIYRLSALLNSLRDVCGDFRGIQFRIGLRSDVYYLVRTSDESTDKITQYLVPLTWTNHEILICIAKRISTYFSDGTADNLDTIGQDRVAQRLHRIIEPLFLGRGKWERAPIHRVLLSLTRRRPRDLVKLLSGAGQFAYANRHSTILTKDLQDTFVSYSQDRLQDIINEFRTELPNVKALLLGMRPTALHRVGDHPFLYKTDELSVKIHNILTSTSLVFSNGDRADFHSIKQFLFKIDFILARSETDEVRAEWVYFDQNRFAASREADFGYSWEVHPAYRWALEKKSVQEIIDQTDLLSLL